MLQAKKKFSQNFLVDKNIRDKALVIMSKIVSIRSDLPLIEIGPGAGDLTREVVTWQNCYSSYIALEIDIEAMEYLESLGLKTNNHPNFNLIHTDAWQSLNNNPQSLTPFEFPQNFNLISSLPYNIGSRIMVDLAIVQPRTNFAVILQKEVATKARIEAKNFNFWGAWINIFWRTKLELILPPSAFSPKPKVHSALLTGIYYENEVLAEFLTNEAKRAKLKEVLKLLFGQPSKTLYNNLKLLKWDKTKIDTFFTHNKIDVRTRLTWDNYQDILVKVMGEVE